MNVARTFGLVVLLSSLGLSSCRREAADAAHDKDHGAEAKAAPSNRVAVSAAVRRNLGLTFAKVERRAVVRSIRLPGRFERPPESYRQYRAGFAGSVDVLVRQFDAVAQGAPLFKLMAPAWREHQEKIAAAESDKAEAEAGLRTMSPLRAAHETHEASLEATVHLWTERIKKLEELAAAGGGKSEELNQARIALTAARAEFADVTEKDADLGAREAQYQAKAASAAARFELHLASAVVMTGRTLEELLAPDERGVPLWRRLDAVTVRAESSGVVDLIGLSKGAWAGEGELVVRSVDPAMLRFRAQGLQSDLGRFRDGMKVSVAPPKGMAGAATLGSLKIGVDADPVTRTVDLIVQLEGPTDWARAGVAAFLEIADPAAPLADAVPLGCIARDGASAVIFRRDPADPDQVIRIEADLGAEDGRYVELKSGVKTGDEVVEDGAYQLMLASSAVDRRGGHFHADGTFHEGEDK